MMRLILYLRAFQFLPLLDGISLIAIRWYRFRLDWYDVPLRAFASACCILDDYVLVELPCCCRRMLVQLTLRRLLLLERGS